MNENFQGLTLWATLQKRTFDLFLAFWGTILFWWLILLAALLAWIDTGENGFFTQKRVGQYGNIFKVIKIRTMRSVDDIDTTVTTSNDLRITSLGHFFRRTKIDELPQLINVFLGDMSFVGPRPDVPGFADKLKGDDRVVLSIKPGITGPATLQFRNEEMLLAEVENPEEYNNEVIYPEKVRLNKEYITNYSIVKDIRYIFLTLMGK
ncbi:MAG: sugar transferase [Candidatus Electrothrix gigas]